MFTHLMRTALCGAVVVAGMATLPSVVIAAPFTAFELIEDAAPYEVGAPSVSRNWGSSLGHAGSGPATNVDGNFGHVNLRDVVYTHDLSWLLPANFTSASLTLKAWGNLGGNDQVVAETINLVGLLNNGAIWTGLFSQTVFGSVSVESLNADGTLSIVIRTNEGAGFFGSLNAFSLYSSRLDVAGSTTDVDPDPVPEPALLLLLGAGLFGGARRLRRR